jgi:hypothetical protein
MKMKNCNSVYSFITRYVLVVVFTLPVLLLLAHAPGLNLPGLKETCIPIHSGAMEMNSLKVWYSGIKIMAMIFLALTDHNVILEGERWRNFPHDHAALAKYVETYGEEWVEMHVHPEEEGVHRVRLKTLEEFRSDYEEPGEFLLIMGNEISNPHAVHLLAFHQDKIIPAIQGKH